LEVLRSIKSIQPTTTTENPTTTTCCKPVDTILLYTFILLFMMTEITVANPDAIVVGSGLAGLTVALHILDRGGSVVILEKEPKMGGNSVKASSGINHALGADQVSKFQQDTLQSAGASAQPELIDILVNKSNDAIQWFQTRIGVDLEEVGQLGGHSTPRTRRPKGGAVGWEIMSRLQKTIQEFPPEKVQLVVNTKVTQLLQDDYGKVIGVQYEESSKTAGNGDIISSQGGEIRAPHVVLCTGGFAADRSSGSLLAQYQPQFLKMGATAGEFSTGDGIKLATPVGAGLVDIEKVQVHPTGFVDLKDPSNPQNILAAELIRGIGGILVDQSGKRYVTTTIICVGVLCMIYSTINFPTG
jgi:succinate dehydrogenase/fumarate reductase flavoprotein subunit